MAMVTVSSDEVAIDTGNLHTMPRGTAGETIIAGYVVCIDEAAGVIIHANAGNAADQAVVVGVALNAAEEGQAVTYQNSGVVDLGSSAAMTIGRVYYLYSADGRIVPESDLSAGLYTTIVGVAESASLLRLAINATGIERA